MNGFRLWDKRAKEWIEIDEQNVTIEIYADGSFSVSLRTEMPDGRIRWVTDDSEDYELFVKVAP